MATFSSTVGDPRFRWGCVLPGPGSAGSPGECLSDLGVALPKHVSKQVLYWPTATWAGPTEPQNSACNLYALLPMPGSAPRPCLDEGPPTNVQRPAASPQGIHAPSSALAPTPWKPHILLQTPTTLEGSSSHHKT